ncbi:unnamed protein product [Medioppia subpectinata]|uniref:Exportin-4 n=1 Tax=Medioppia subpectinata TaxID=1979941 RepID=A0A7R9KBU9_9ACAR|nr:unnamed protein product [Medioppia subpectinata]CAG2100589.1 unnamed protein product [Medioppia subpectinata]
MNDNIVKQLESCAQMLLAPPECVSQDQRNGAQQVFIEFQKTKCPFDLCRDILESSGVAFVQFQTGCCLKNGVIRDWNCLSEDQRKILLKYLNQYVNSRQLEAYVCEQLLLVCAIIVKRIAIDEGNDSQSLTQILTFLYETVSNGSSGHNSRMVCCTSVLSILNEYSSSTRASDFGLSWATHLRAKKKFENTHLKSIFRCVVSTLVTHLRISDAESRGPEWTQLATKLLRICDFILSWNFDVITIFSSQYAKHVDSIENPVLQPAIDWKEVLLDGDVISIFMEMHLCLRTANDEKLFHYSLQCINQLSSLNGPIIINAENRSKFLKTIITGTIGLVNQICDTITIAEVVPITTVINRICVRLQSRDQINFVEFELLKTFLEIHDVIKLEALAVWTRPIFEAFVRIHLSQPEGLRQPATEIEDDIQEFEDNDIILYGDQLNAIGCIARIDSNHAVNCLTHILSLRVNQFETCLRRDSQSQEKTNEWIALSEDLHWLVLITSNLLTQTNYVYYGERELIPSQLMSLSIAFQSDLNQTVQSVQNLDPFSSAATDPINDYPEMSIALNSCFGRDSPVANGVLNLIVDHIITKLVFWSSETQVTEESSLALVHFVKNCIERCKALNNCANMNKLLNKHSANELQNLSINTRKNIYQVLVHIVTYNHELYDQLFQPLMDRYTKIRASIEERDTGEPLRAAIVELYECLEGIACGTTAVNISSVWPNFIAPIFHDLPKILSFLHNYNSIVVAVLNLLAQLTNRILCYLSDNDIITFYNTSISILNEYAKHNCNRCVREGIDDEETCNDILVILNFLNDLAAKDFIEWFHDSRGDQNSNISATQVVFVGLNIIMPLIGAPLLEFPKLCQSYYKLIVFLCEDPERLHGLPDPLLQSIVQSVQLALKSTFGNEVKSNCLTIISVLGTHAMREPNKFVTLVQLVEPFLRLIFEFTLFECGTSNDVTMRESVANALFSLICCFPSRYQELAQQIISSSKEESVQKQLQTAFEKLMEGLSLDGARVHRAAFKRRFETFVIEIQGLLCIK